MSTMQEDCAHIETQNVVAFHYQPPPLPSEEAEESLVDSRLSPTQSQIVVEVATLLKLCAETNTRQIRTTAIAAILCALTCFGFLHVALTALTQDKARTTSAIALSKTSPLDSFARMEEPRRVSDPSPAQNGDATASSSQNSNLAQFLRWQNENDTQQK